MRAIISAIFLQHGIVSLNFRNPKKGVQYIEYFPFQRCTYLFLLNQDQIKIQLLDHYIF